MKKILCLTILIIAFSIAGFADVARPKEPKPTPTPKQAKQIDTLFTIRLDRDAKVARLVIPTSQVKQLRAELDQLDDATDNIAAVTGTFSRTQTIVSGMFLSLALVFGGMWFARSGKATSRSAKALIIGAAFFATGALATMVFANAGPPAEARSITGKIFAPSVHVYKTAWGQIKMETSEKSGPVELIVPDPPDKPSGEE